MTFQQDAKLFDVLAMGYHLNTQLQALLGRPLDSLGQQKAMAFSQELSRVFEVSMSMLNSNTVTRVKTAPEIRTGDGSGVIIQAAKDKRARYMLITEGVWALSLSIQLCSPFFFFFLRNFAWLVVDCVWIA